MPRPFPAGILTYVLLCAIGVSHFFGEASATLGGFGLAALQSAVFAVAVTAVFVTVVQAWNLVASRGNGGGTA